MTGGLLVSDDERDFACSVLATAFAQGRLTSEEHDARVGRAVLARTSEQLRDSLAGIPVAARTLAVRTDPSAEMKATLLTLLIMVVITALMLLPLVEPVAVLIAHCGATVKSCKMPGAPLWASRYVDWPLDAPLLALFMRRAFREARVAEQLHRSSRKRRELVSHISA